MNKTEVDTVCSKIFDFFKPPLKNSPLEKIYDPDTEKCSLGADFYDIKPFRAFYLLVRYSYGAEYKADFSTRAGPSQYTFYRSFKFDSRKLSKGALNFPPCCNNIPKWDSKMLEPLGLGKEQWEPHWVASDHQTALPQMWQWTHGCIGPSNFGLWHQREQKWTSTTSPDQFLPQGVSGRYIRGLTNTQIQTLTTQLITEFIVTFPGVLFDDRKQSNEASIDPSQVQGALTSLNPTLERYCS